MEERTISTVDERVLGFVARMPALSPTVGKIVALANDIDSSARDMVQVIRVDPVLMAKVLKLINSTYFGMSRQVTSINQAVLLLGMNTVKNLALSTAVVGSVAARRDSPFDLRLVWEHALGAATAAKLIAKRRGVDVKDLEEYFIGGLLHDIGQILLVAYVPAAYKRVAAASDEGATDLCDEERKVFGCNHAELGALVAEKWGLSPNLVAAIHHHHAPERAGGSVDAAFVATIAAANYFVHKLGIGFRGDALFDPLPEAVWTHLGLTERVLDVATFDSLEDEIHKASVFLSS